MKKLSLYLSAILMVPPLASAAEHGGSVSTKATPLFEIFSLPITNSIVTAWIVAILLIVLLRFAIGKPKLVPGKAQLAIETIIDMFKGILEPIIGKKAFPAAFPLLICMFFFILAQNWAGLIPGVGTLTYGGEAIFRPLGADMNGTLGLALVSFGAWFFLIFKYAGPKAVIHDWFGNKADKHDVPIVIYYFLSLIFFLVGFIEIISIVFRPVSLSFRLFGNVFGGETLMHATGYFTVFYFLELLVGIVQALVFTLLSAVYIGLITNHDSGHEEESVPAK